MPLLTANPPPLRMPLLTDEDPATLSEAVSACLLSCDNAADRKTLLMVLESSIQQRTGCQTPLSSYYNDLTSVNYGHILSLLLSEIEVAKNRPHREEMENFLDNLVQDDDDEEGGVEGEVVAGGVEAGVEGSGEGGVEGGVVGEVEVGVDGVNIGGLVLEDVADSAASNEADAAVVEKEEEEFHCHFEISDSPEPVIIPVQPIPQLARLVGGPETPRPPRQDYEAPRPPRQDNEAPRQDYETPRPPHMDNKVARGDVTEMAPPPARLTRTVSYEPERQRAMSNESAGGRIQRISSASSLHRNNSVPNGDRNSVVNGDRNSGTPQRRERGGSRRVYNSEEVSDI
eukprot:sb/3479719/